MLSLIIMAMMSLPVPASISKLCSRFLKDATDTGSVTAAMG
jgi:hypothetical protein